MKKILMIATGGTIACAKGNEGLSPSYAADNLLSYVSEVKNFCRIDTCQLLNLDSTNMRPECWVKIAEHIIKNYDMYDGFVITHGTDTLAYTAAALSYMLQNLGKPVVITGAQRPIAAKETDGINNLVDAIRFSLENVGGVYTVFNGKVIIGTRAAKIRTKSYNAFESINYPYIAFIEDGKVRYNDNLDIEKCCNKPVFNTNITSKVFLLKLIPGMDPDILDYIKNKYEGLIIESYGSGGIPFEEGINLLPKIKAIVDKGIAVVVTTQVILEGSDLSLYEVGQKALKTPVIPAYDMTREAAVVKLMWALGQTKEFNKVKELFLTPISHDVIYNKTK